MNLRVDRQVDDYKRLLNHYLAMPMDDPDRAKCKQRIVNIYQKAEPAAKQAMDDFAGAILVSGGPTISLGNNNDG